MCGIAGICNLREPVPISSELITCMLGTINHRGPDEAGIYIDDCIGLGHARLRIIDLTSGIQPIHNEDETLWIAYNGEVFNFPELREDLIKKGHRFYTHTDAEVMLHLFESKGPSCLDDLNGQFAFAIWNSKDKELFLARDRIGICPLHYTVHSNRLIFASEIKSIFMTDDLPCAIDPIAMDQIFTFWAPLPGRTFFKDIKELPPGHYLKLSRGNISIRKYWEIPLYSPDEYTERPLDDICEQLSALLNDTIRIRLRADVPVGSYLSGGLDSSGVTALVRKNFNNSLRTFGIHFEEKDFDESDHQNYMVTYLKTDHTDVRATNTEIGESFPSVLWHCEKPILRTAPVPLFILSDRVNQSGFKVVLTGEGADEIFGGYNIYKEAKVRRFWSREPDSKLRPLAIRRLYPYIFNGNPRGQAFALKFFGRNLEKADDPFFSHLIRWENTSRLKTLFSNDIRSTTDDYYAYDDLGEQIPDSFSNYDYLTRAQYLEMAIFLGNYLLSSQGDRVSMAHSVEMRPPFLDHRIIDFMAHVPSKWKIKGLNEKYILKKTFKGIVPEPIINRPKQPYRAPISQSLLNGNPEHIHEMLTDKHLKDSGLFDVSKVRLLTKKLKKAQKISEFDNMALAGIVSSQIVYDKFIAHFPSKPAVTIRPSLCIDKRSGGTMQ